MPTPILMPALSPTMEEGKLAKWLVKEGDTVASGDVIAEIETDKATMEVEAADEGKLGKILVPEGTDGVKVNTPIAVLLGEGESAADIGDVAAAAKPAPKTEKPRAEASKAEAPKPPAPEAQISKAQAPQAQASQAQAQRAEAAKPVAEEGRGERIFASPLARRLAREAGLDLAALQGSGPHGRIVKADIEQAISTGIPVKAPAQPAPAQAAGFVAGPSSEEIRRLYEEGSYELVPHDSMRRTIARRLTQAKQTIPHFYLTVDVIIDALLEARARLNARAPKGPDGAPAYKISVNDFVIKAMGSALQQVPDANVTWTEEGMLRHRKSDVGVAVAIRGGLITPVVRNVETKGLATISNEMKDYAARARARKLKPEEYQGGTTAISNLGMYGIKDFAAVINPPQATILAVGEGEKRPIVINDAVVVRTVMSLTLSTDHRAVDGALGAEFLQVIKNLLEDPAMMLV
ncbi:pyruvate dehydrogenase complex dihydrolipoamide acetyltransferase [Rhodoligotrophos defluvii]|uniref:pyruvate dehydrogenase complex dihydrolipoamide acetyltransferase n=1 Tax=Rhodoligotrophos defluvii TaxID=2561934 RepID=UPI0010C9FF8C|nr:pyruvate dehydrogenase complex dihydrolipoamide acetyltransferase [Rhodoligotrophos defluvii]